MKIFGQKITFGFTHRIEMVLLFLYAVLFLTFDIVQNRIINAKSFDIIIYGMKALDLAVILLIAFHLILIALIMMSVNSKSTSTKLDYIIGAITGFGVAIILTGFILTLFTNNINFLFIDLPILSFYHIGVTFEVIGGIYYAVTK